MQYHADRALRTVVFTGAGFFRTAAQTEIAPRLRSSLEKKAWNPSEALTVD